MIVQRRENTVAVSEVEEHADEDMVAAGGCSCGGLDGQWSCGHCSRYGQTLSFLIGYRFSIGSVRSTTALVPHYVGLASVHGVYFRAS